jgi:hypothetical protein
MLRIVARVLIARQCAPFVGGAERLVCVRFQGKVHYAVQGISKDAGNSRADLKSQTRHAALQNGKLVFRRREARLIQLFWELHHEFP